MGALRRRTAYNNMDYDEYDELEERKPFSMSSSSNPGNSPAHRMARLSVDEGTGGGPRLPHAHALPEQGNQATSSSSSTPAQSTSTSTPARPSSRRARETSRRFTCNYPECGKTFTTSGHLARHVRLHTGEKAFQCTFPACESRFSRHDNMLQHYRNHIVRNARRRKKAYAAAMASGVSADVAGEEIYGDLSPSTTPIPLLSTGGTISVYPPSTSSAASVSTGSSEPIFVHSTYSTLSHLGGPTRLSAAAIAAATTASTSSTTPAAGPSSFGAGVRGSIASRRASARPGPPPRYASTSSTASGASTSPRSKASHSHLGASHRSTYGGPSDLESTRTLAPPPSAPSTSSTFLSPPLASPSVMDHPHTATTTSFFLASMGSLSGIDSGAGSASANAGAFGNTGVGSSGVALQPPPLMHRHSYSALGNHPRLEPITPMSELPSYPVYSIQPQTSSHHHQENSLQQHQHQHQYQLYHAHPQYPQYPHSPGYPESPHPLSPYPLPSDLENTAALQAGGVPYSPALSAASTTFISASPRLLDGSLPTPSHEMHPQQNSGYFQLSTSTSSSTAARETFYDAETYAPSTSNSSPVMPTHHLHPALSNSQQRQYTAPIPSASYPPTYPHSGSLPSSSYMLQPQHPSSAPIHVLGLSNTRHVVTQNPIRSGLGVTSDDDLTTITRSSSLSTSAGAGTGGGAVGHLATVLENEATQVEGGHYTTTAPSGLALYALGTARWLRSPSAGMDYAPSPVVGQGQSPRQGGIPYSQVNGSWQPDFGTTSSSHHAHTSTQHWNARPSTAKSTSPNQGSIAPSAVSAPSSVIGDQSLSVADPDERAYRQSILEDPAFGFHESATW